jgi:hypothetical protein
MKNDGMTIFDVVGYGPVVFSNEECGVIITINGSYLNWWVFDGEGYHNTECRSGHPDLYNLTCATAMDLAEAWFNEVVNGVEEEDETAA